MGYRSDVAYAIAGSRDDIRAFLTTCRLQSPKLVEAINEGQIVEVPNSPGLVAFLCRFQNVKWYDSYPDVQMHEQLWRAAMDPEHEDGGCSLSGKFIRIGESDDDLEQRDFGDEPFFDLLSISRSIVGNLVDCDLTTVEL